MHKYTVEMQGVDLARFETSVSIHAGEYLTILGACYLVLSVQHKISAVDSELYMTCLTVILKEKE